MSNNRISRRSLLKFVGAGAVTVSTQLPIMNQSVEAAPNRQEQTNRPWYELGFMDDPLMNERLLFVLGHSWFRMAEISEALDTARRIESGSSESWRREWFRTADRVRASGDTSLAQSHSLTAGESYLRATAYYLAGLLYSEGPTDEVRQRSQEVADVFQQALAALDVPGQYVEIPYEDSALPAYFFRSPLATGKAPVLIAHQGMDASVEDVFYLAQECIKRGYHCLLLHHPGQGLALRLKGLTYRPDWENVITPVVDYVVQQPGVDPERIALVGYSFGGALVTRAAAFEKRLKITIANPAVYSWWEFFEAFLFGQYPEMAQLLDSDPEAFNAAFNQFLGAAPSMYQWWVNSAQWKFGANSPADLLTKLKAYTNADIADKVTCTMLVMDGEGETWAAGQAKRLYDALTCPKEYMLFTAEDTGLLHCQTGAVAVANQRMFDWLDEHI